MQTHSQKQTTLGSAPSDVTKDSNQRKTLGVHLCETHTCGPCLWVPLLSTWPATHEPFLGCVLRTQMGLVATVVGLGMSSCCGTGRKLRDTRGPSPTLVPLASAPHQEVS